MQKLTKFKVIFDICSKREIRFYLLVKSYLVVIAMQRSVIFMKILTIYTLNLRLLTL